MVSLRRSKETQSRKTAASPNGWPRRLPASTATNARIAGPMAKSDRIVVRLESEMWATLHAKASALGLGDAAFVRMLIYRDVSELAPRNPHFPTASTACRCAAGCGMAERLAQKAFEHNAVAIAAARFTCDELHRAVADRPD